MKAKCYVGITGLTTKNEVKDICDSFSYSRRDKNSHIPMLGYLVSQKTLNGLPTENRRYPPVSKLKDLLRSTNEGVLKMIHYNSREKNALADQISDLFNNIYNEGLCRAIQLNIAWPDEYQIKKIKERFPLMQIVFQASGGMIQEESPKSLAQKIKVYGDTINYVLIDPSGGRGQPFNIEKSLAIYSELIEHNPGLTIGFAGGFTGQNVFERVSKISDSIGHSSFCIDAEGGLRDKISDRYGDDLLNIEEVKSYLKFSFAALNKNL